MNTKTWKYIFDHFGNESCWIKSSNKLYNLHAIVVHQKQIQTGI